MPAPHDHVEGGDFAAGTCNKMLHGNAYPNVPNMQECCNLCTAACQRAKPATTGWMGGWVDLDPARPRHGCPHRAQGRMMRYHLHKL